MKTLLCIVILVLTGLVSVHAQSPEKTHDVSKKGRDRLFPDFAQDIARLEAAGKTNSVKPPQALATSPRAVRDLIFLKSSGSRLSGAAPATALQVAPEQRQLPSALSSAETAKAVEEDNAAARAKIKIPNTDQGSENGQPAPKPKN